MDWCEDHKIETIRTNVIGCLNVAGNIWFDDFFQSSNFYVLTKIFARNANCFTYCMRLVAFSSMTTSTLLVAKAFVRKTKLISMEVSIPTRRYLTFNNTNSCKMLLQITSWKALVEDLLTNYSYTCTLRVRMPISDDLSARNFVTKIVKYDKVFHPSSDFLLDDIVPSIHCNNLP